MNVWRLGAKWGNIPTLEVMVQTKIGFYWIDWNQEGIAPGDCIAVAKPGSKSVAYVGVADTEVCPLTELLSDAEKQGPLSEWISEAKGFRFRNLWKVSEPEQFSTGDYKQLYSLGNDKNAWNKTVELVKAFKGEEIMNNVRRLLDSNKNIVLTGAPGTGKTYLARQIARSMVLSEEEKKLPQSEIDNLIEERTSFVQFHPSYDYTDFVEGLRPIRVGEDASSIGFERKDGIFKVLCRRALESAEVGRVDNFDESWTRLIAKLNENGRITIPLISGRGDFPISLNEYGNGLAIRTYDEAGKDWIRGQSKFFTKEQLYNVYLGKSGVPSGGHDNYRKAIVEFMITHCRLEPFQAGTSVMVASPQPYVMIIDEINRGDISKIFGELFYAIDKGYRGKLGSVKTQYQNLVKENDPFFDGFYVPENVYIIGTMNDIDRNVESMDFAIRRRFAWEEIKPEERFDAMMSDLKDATGTAIPEDVLKQAKERMVGLNSAICDKKHGLGSAYQIGPSYFMKIADYTGDASVRFESLWTHHLKPLIMEYLRGMPNANDTIHELKFAYDHGKADNAESIQTPAESAG